MIISEQEAKVIVNYIDNEWYEGIFVDGDIALIKKLLVYYPSLQEEITLMEFRESKQ